MPHLLVQLASPVCGQGCCISSPGFNMDQFTEQGLGHILALGLARPLVKSPWTDSGASLPPRSETGFSLLENSLPHASRS